MVENCPNGLKKKQWEKEKLLVTSNVKRLGQYTRLNKGRFGKRLTLSPNDKYVHSSKFKEFADENFKLGETCRKFSKTVENTVGK